MSFGTLWKQYGSPFGQNVSRSTLKHVEKSKLKSETNMAGES